MTFFLHYSCSRDKFIITDHWLSKTKDSYIFKADKTFIKILNSSEDIKLYGNWEKQDSKSIYVLDTLKIFVKYEKVLVGETYERILNEKKQLIIHLLNKDEIMIMNENNILLTRFIKK